MDNFMPIMVTIMAFVISTGGGYIIKYLNTKVGSEKLQNYYFVVKSVVMALEQTEGSLSGVDKKALAIEKIKILTKNKLTDKEIDSLIEAAVYEVKKLLNPETE